MLSTLKMVIFILISTWNRYENKKNMSYHTEADVLQCKRSIAPWIFSIPRLPFKQLVLIWVRLPAPRYKSMSLRWILYVFIIYLNWQMYTIIQDKSKTVLVKIHLCQLVICQKKNKYKVTFWEWQKTGKKRSRRTSDVVVNLFFFSTLSV